METRTEFLHREAMRLVQQLLVLKESKGDDVAKNSLLAKAFELEFEAAMSLGSQFDKEPARSILFRSAAALAIDCGKWKEAEKLIYFGLAGNVPEMIKKQFFMLYQRLQSQPEVRGLPLAWFQVNQVKGHESLKKEIEVFDRVVLMRDIPGRDLQSGDVGTITGVLEDGKVFKVEFFALDGSSIAELIVDANIVKPASSKMVQHVREMA